MPKTVDVGLIQMACGTDFEKNLNRAVDFCKQAAKQNAQIICLPELYRTPYPCQEESPDIFDWAETIPGASTETFASLAKKLGAVIIVPIFEKRADGLYHNTAAVFLPDGKLAGLYRKMHIPDDPGYYEKFYFTPGDLGFRAFETPFGKIGVLICWDQWFPEAARLTALQGAQILFYPTAIGWECENRDGENERRVDETQQQRRQSQVEAWQTAQHAHAIANGVYVASVNRIGTEGGTEFWGNSFTCNPFGQMLNQSEQEETVLITSCDLDEVDQTRRLWPFLRDRRIDAYGGMTERFGDVK